MGSVGAESVGIIVDANDHVETSGLKAETQAAGPAEQVRSKRRLMTSDEGAQFRRIINSARMPAWVNEWPTYQLHAVLRLRHGQIVVEVRSASTRSPVHC